MAALTRPSEATYEVHEEVTVDTNDNEDHTFCGIMFPVKCRDLLPLHHLVINSVAVRGQLGPMTVWIYNRKKMNSLGNGATATNNNNNNNNSSASSTNAYSVSMHPRDWTKIYDQRHAPSPRNYQKLVFNKPIVLTPGQVIVLYIHSSLPGDQAIVYDDRRSASAPPRNFLRQVRGGAHNRPQPRRETVSDRCLEILPARAHVSNEPFGSRPIWGWGFAWRDEREFVGQLDYGCVYQLWNPTSHLQFASKFNRAVQTLLLCQRRYEAVWSMLPDDCIYYILNMCRWDWFNDDEDDYKQNRRQRITRRREAQQTMTSDETATKLTPSYSPIVGVSECNSPSPCCSRMRTPSASDVTMISESHLSNHHFDDVEGEDDDEEEVEAYVPLEGEDEDEDENGTDNSDSDDEDEDEDDVTVEGAFFRFNAASDDEEEADDHQGGNNNTNNGQEEHFEDDDETSRAWIRRQFARLHVLRALAALDDNADAEMNV